MLFLLTVHLIKLRNLPGMQSRMDLVLLLLQLVRQPTLQELLLPMDGLDSLLSMVQMPKGIPVAAVAIDGAENAALLAVQILSLGSNELKARLKVYKEDMAEQTMEKDQLIQKELEKL